MAIVSSTQVLGCQWRKCWCWRARHSCCRSRPDGGLHGCNGYAHLFWIVYKSPAHTWMDSFIFMIAATDFRLFSEVFAPLMQPYADCPVEPHAARGRRFLWPFHPRSYLRRGAYRWTSSLFFHHRVLLQPYDDGAILVWIGLGWVGHIPDRVYHQSLWRYWLDVSRSGWPCRRYGPQTSVGCDVRVFLRHR
jgi:hypothetical protein